MKLYDEGIGYGMASHHIFPPGYKLVKEVTHDTDLIVLGGGSDIDPELYDNDNVACGGINHARDAHDLEIYRTARRLNLPILGICRGAQFLNAMNGGTMIQDINGHLGSHKMLLDPELIDDLNFEMIVSSTHHQMMVPHVSGEVLGYSLVRDHRRDKYDTTRVAASQVPKVDPEIVFYPSTRSLCVQFHPEYYSYKHPLSKFVQNLCTLLLGVKNVSD